MARNSLAALDATGKPTSWDPSPDGDVNAIVTSSSKVVYVGGSFANVGGQARSHLAAINASGKATTWNPGADGDVYCLGIGGTWVYAGGAFRTVATQTRNHLASVTTGGEADRMESQRGRYGLLDVHTHLDHRGRWGLQERQRPAARLPC